MIEKTNMVTSGNIEFRMERGRIGLFNTHFQNFKQFGVPKAQLILADVPYNLGRKAYGFEIKKDFFVDACDLINENYSPSLFANISKIKGENYVEQNLF